MPVRTQFAAVAALALAGCATRTRPDTVATPAPARRVAALDTAAARRICAAPDSVVAGRAPCVLRNQAPPIRVF